MTRRSSIVSLAVVLSIVAALVGLPRPAESQAAQVLGGLTLSAVFQDMERTVGRLIEDAGARADMTLLTGAHAAELAIDRARNAYQDSLTSTVDALDTAERDTVVRLFRMVQEMEDAFASEIGRVAAIEEGLADTVGRLPTVRRAPSILGWGPLYQVGRRNQPYRLTIEGRHLGEGDPFARIGNRRLEPITKTTNQLVFLIPWSAFPADTFAPVTLDLTLFHEKTKWLVFSELREVPFRVTVYAAPPRLGQATVYGKRKVETVTREARTTRKGVGCHADHCRSCGSSERVAVNGPGEALVLSSVRVHTSYDRNGSFSVKDVSPGGFTMSWRARSYGCGPVWQGTRGQIRARVSYQVERREPALEEVLVAEDQAIEWGRDLRLSTAEPLDSVTVVLDHMLGGTEVMGPGERGRFVEVHYDRGVNELSVRPRPLELALRER